MARQRRARSSKGELNQPLRLAIKFNDRLTKPPQKLHGLDAFLERFGARGGLRLMPLIELLEPSQLNKLVDRARKNDPEYTPPNFVAWVQVVCPEGVDPEELARAIRRLPDVETAYVMRPGPPPVNPADDPRNANQGYLDAAPNGIDARYAWNSARRGSMALVSVMSTWNRAGTSITRIWPPPGLRLSPASTPPTFPTGRRCLVSCRWSTIH